MPIVVRIDVMRPLRTMKPKKLAALIGISEQSLSPLPQETVKGARFETIDKTCALLARKPSGLLARIEDSESED